MNDYIEDLETQEPEQELPVLLIHVLSNADLYTGLSYEYKGVTPPYNATEVALIPEKDGFARRFLRGVREWEYVALGTLTPPAPTPPTLEQAKATKLLEINSIYEDRAQLVRIGVPENEVLTWDIQKLEAEAWQINSAASTPLIDELARSREMDRVVLLGKVLEKVTAYRVYIGGLTGVRQRLEDLISVATTVEQVEAITWPTN